MNEQTLRSLLDDVEGIRHACDLDVLLFFYRHPSTLLVSEQLVAYVGYERDRVAKSLEGLIEAGQLTRSRNPSHAAHLYELDLGGSAGGRLAFLLEIAATRQGRLNVLRLLEKTGLDPAPGAPVRRSASVTALVRPPEAE